MWREEFRTNFWVQGWFQVKKFPANWIGANKIYIFFGGGMSGWAVNASHSRSGGPGFKSHPSGCFLTQGTLLQFVSLHPSV